MPRPPRRRPPRDGQAAIYFNPITTENNNKNEIHSNGGKNKEDNFSFDRNSQFNELKKRNCTPFFFDPHVLFEENETLKKYNFIKSPKKHFYDGILICVDHAKFKAMGFSKISQNPPPAVFLCGSLRKISKISKHPLPAVFPLGFTKEN